MNRVGERRSSGPLHGVVLAVLGVLLLAGIAGVVGANPSAASAGASAVTAEAATAAQQLLLASESLASGQGPADGQAVTCSMLAASQSASCSAGTASGAQFNTTAFWNEEIAPPARAGAAMTYDGKDRYVVLFGGFNSSGYLGDTWEFLHSQWINLPEKVAPSARANASMAYDGNFKDRYVVLFGGQNSSGALSDTWKFVGGAWTQLFPSMSPSARTGASLTYDTHDSYLLLFGGDAGGKAQADTWSFSAGTWTLQTPSAPPPGRWNAAMTYDSMDSYVVLFGGFTGSTYLGDTWEYQLGQWTQLTPSPAPAPRALAMMSFDPYSFVNYTVLFGGVSQTGSTWNEFGDTWKFLGGTWTALNVAIAPSARQSAPSTYDGSDNAILLFAGSTDGNPLTAQDTWEYAYNNTTLQVGWNQLVQESATQIEEPSARYGAAMAPDAGTQNGDLLFGGSTEFGPNGQTWQFTIPGSKKTNYWTELFPSMSPSPRSYASMAWDAADNYVLLFGGMSGTGGALADTWEFSSGSWTQLHPSSFPMARYGAGMTYDPTDGYVVLFGGTNGATYFPDTWSFNAGQWTERATTGPTAVAFAGLAWNPALKYVQLYGGTTGGSASSNLWKYSAGVWTQLHPKGQAPPAEWGMTFVGDPKDNYTYMFGGCSAASFNPMSPSCPSADVQGTTWKVKGNFTSIATTGHNQAPPDAVPTARYLAAGAFWYPFPKSSTEYTLLIDGISANGVLLQQRWSYQAKIYSLWYPDPLPEARYGQLETQDIRDQQALMFGGIGPVSGGGLGYLDDTWMWDTGVWGATHSPSSPSARAFGTMSSWYPSISSHFACTGTCFTLLFGGVGPKSYLGDTWKWVGSPYGGSWTELSSGGGPSPRANATMTFDAKDGYIVLFGGQDASGVLGDTWTWTVSAGWKQLSPSTSPSAREGQVMVYDSEDGYVLMFGGMNGLGQTLNDTWKFQAGNWVPLNIPGPSPRVGAMMYDAPLPAGYGFVLMVGGYTGSAFLGDTWAYAGGVWHQLPTKPASFVPFAWGGMDNDVDDGHPNFFGGLSAGGIVDAFWEFKHGP